MAMQELNYERDIAINLHNLVQEWLEQPQLVYYYSAELSSAKRTLARIQERKKTVRSKLIKEANANPSILPGGKVSLPLVEAHYRTSPEYTVAADEEIEQQYTVDILDGALTAVKQRKEALQDEVKLWLGKYYAGPQEPLELLELIKEKHIISQDDLALAQTSAQARRGTQPKFQRRS